MHFPSFEGKQALKALLRTQALDQTSHTVQRVSERDKDRKRATDLDHRCQPQSQVSGASNNLPPREGEASADAATGMHGCPASPADLPTRAKLTASNGPHRAETFPGRAPLPVTPVHRTQTASERQHGRSVGTGLVRPGRAGPDHGAPKREDRHRPSPPHCSSPPWTSRSCEPAPVPWALQAGRAAPSGAGSGVLALHGGRSPVWDHRREPGDSADPADRTQKDNTERWRRGTNLPPTSATAPLL